jgi:hypothetical protein
MLADKVDGLVFPVPGLVLFTRETLGSSPNPIQGCFSPFSVTEVVAF